MPRALTLSLSQRERERSIAPPSKSSGSSPVSSATMACLTAAAISLSMAKFEPDTRASAQGIAFQDGEEDMILPGAVDLEIAPRIAFLTEAAALEQPARGRVVRQACRLHAMEREP